MTKFNGYIYTRSQKIALITIGIIAIIAIGINITIRTTRIGITKNKNLITTDSLIEISSTFQSHIVYYDSLHRRQWNPPRHTTIATSAPFVFDPNSIDSAQMIALGFKGFMVSNLLHYRAKGGKIRTAEQLKKIYGIDTSLVDKLIPYIHIDSAAIGINAKRDTTKSHHTYTAKHYFSFDVNHADTATLARLPGIGHARAAQIVGYRNALGGYHSVHQLAGIHQMPDSIIDSLAKYITADTTLLRRIPINRSSVKQLRRHPYINFYQAHAIHTLRWDKNHNGILTPDDMKQIKAFSADSLALLMPYLDFSTKK